MRHLYKTSMLSLALASPLAWSMDLQQAYELALSNDPDWSSTIENYHASQEVSQQAKSALLPNFSANANVSSNHIDPSEPIPSFGLYNRTYTDKSYGVQAMQPLFNADAWHGYHLAQALTSQAQAGFANDEQQFILNVATTYFNVLRASENLVYEQAQELAIGRQLAQTKKRFEVGMVSITEVHEAQAAYDSSVADRISAETQVSTSEENLFTMTSKHDDHLAVLRADAPVTEPPEGTESTWINKSAQDNPRIIAARYAYQAAQETTRQQRSGYLPNLALVGNWQDVNTGGANPLIDGKNSSVALQLNVPIYSGGLTQSKVRQALAHEYAARDQLEYAQRLAIQDTHNSYLTVTTDAARVKARQQAVSSSQSALVATQAGYDVGTRDIVEVLQAQRDLYAAKSAYANARYDYVLDGLRLKAAAGELSAIDIAHLNRWLDADASISVNSLNPEINAPQVPIAAPDARPGSLRRHQ